MSTHGPSLEEMTLSDTLSGVGMGHAVADGPLSHAHVIETDGKVDKEKTIEHLLHDGQNVVAKSVPEAKADYRWIPGYDAISNIYKTVKDGIIAKGKGAYDYASRLKDAIRGAFDRTARENAMAKALARFQAAPLSGSKKAAVALAKMNHDYHLVDPINSATSTSEVASYIRGTLESIQEKVTQGLTYTGKVGPLKEAYAGALGGKH